MTACDKYQRPAGVLGGPCLNCGASQPEHSDSIKLDYAAALHAIQTGVAFEMERGSKETSPKHLRVGINSALINDAALVRLLVKKGLFTMDEYADEVTAEANREVERYEQRLKNAGWTNVTLR